MEEEWKPIKGYEGLYEVSNTGRVKSLHRPQSIILKQGLNLYGYMEVNLCKDGICNMKQVHRLVASAFIPNPLNKPEVNHIDGNKDNNNVDNLEWATRRENMNHAVKMGLCDECIKKRSYPVIVFDMDGNFIGKFHSQTMAAKYLGIIRGSISEVLCGKREIACGYRFERINQPV